MVDAPVDSVLAAELEEEGPRPGLLARARDYARRHPTVVIGGGLLLIMAIVAIIAPLIAPDPLRLNPINRLKPPGEKFWFGADFLGRDVYARTIYGGQISLIVGLAVAAVSTVIGLAIGLTAGYVRWVDAIVMRIMDGLMAIPVCCWRSRSSASPAPASPTSSSPSPSPRCPASCALSAPWC